MNAIKLLLKVYLQGAFDTVDMRTDLNPVLPSSTPYTNTTPFFNTERVEMEITPEMVDWVLIKLRTVANDPTSTVLTTSGIVRKDGFIILNDIDNDVAGIDLTQQYYVTVQHRNHIGIESHEPLGFVGNYMLHDFTLQDSSSPTIPNSAQILQSGSWMMVACNGSQGTAHSDINASDQFIVNQQLNEFGYLSGDYNMDGVVNSADDTFWTTNNGKLTLVVFD